MSQEKQPIELSKRTRSPSPAPTYRSTLEPKDDVFTPSSSSKTPLDHLSYALDSKHHHHQDYKEKEHDHTFTPTAEPFDKSHPHYAPPKSPPPPPSPPFPSPSPPKRSRTPRLAPWIPWLLTLIFFLTTLWFISIALGSRLLIHILQPSSSPIGAAEINIQINGVDFSRDPRVSMSVVTLAPTPTTTATRGVGGQENGNPGTTAAPALTPPDATPDGPSVSKAPQRKKDAHERRGPKEKFWSRVVQERVARPRETGAVEGREEREARGWKRGGEMSGVVVVDGVAGGEGGVERKDVVQAKRRLCGKRFRCSH
ncbi:hypothetical protein BU24DRAFT_143871 [Aaosphaeria arxii CBS 175.79]|uniref:Uncharacterized protein n=1 Tax=Aaosphaeria arxii CBS 175.79 TaxID=1450172 RepID=A0A6A5XWP2_9PLEO|nr:uncharacterized protein BU24DRAFT_143871 [Aaosphaeria arxii CBS 175.79]KAF2017111.1 hypothetical protein BU24DRAFT_143871 [Aaosphaeria arxii CBS 175.79]